MKKQIIILVTIMTMMSVGISAQICPPTNSSRWTTSNAYNNFGWNSNSLYSSANPLQRLSYSFTQVINEGWRRGNLTDREIRGLEQDFRRVEREMIWASTNRHISYHEQTMIDMQIRRLNRNIEREWNDNDTRIG